MMGEYSRRDFLKRSGMAAAGALTLSALVEFLESFGGRTGAAWAADYTTSAAFKAAKDLVDKSTAHVTQWDGPTSGPKAVPNKFIVYTSVNQLNGGALGVGQGVEEACKALGWKFRLLDGRGTADGQTNAINEAIALKPDAIVNGTIDAAFQKTAFAKAASLGIKVVGWHAAGKPGPIQDPPHITNLESDPVQTGAVAGAYTVVRANGQAGVVVFTDSEYAIAIVKSTAIQKEVSGVPGSTVLSLEDTPLAYVQTRMPPLMTALYQKFGKTLNWMVGINDLYFDYAAPTLRTLGVPPSGPGSVQMVSAGDGSVSAYNRVRQGQYQAATIPEPLHLHGWQAIDELNRAFAGQPPSDYITPVHLVTQENIQFDGGPNNVFDPDNGYREQYKKIWGV
jgi:ribose transport system substrate-binding protein